MGYRLYRVEFETAAGLKKKTTTRNDEIRYIMRMMHAQFPKLKRNCDRLTIPSRKMKVSFFYLLAPAHLVVCRLPRSLSTQTPAPPAASQIIAILLLMLRKFLLPTGVSQKRYHPNMEKNKRMRQRIVHTKVVQKKRHHSELPKIQLTKTLFYRGRFSFSFSFFSFFFFK